MIAGLDASNVNGAALNWADLKRQHNLSFAAFKATEGRGFRDPLFPAAWKAIGELGLVRAAYHFGHPLTDPQAQADAFLAYVRAAGLEDGDLLALDLEVNDNLGPAHVAAWGREFCARITAQAGRKPLVYTFIAFAEDGNCAGLSSYPLWIADPSSTPGRPRVPAPWTSWAVHQFGQQGLDLDVANYPDGTAMTAALGARDWQEAMMNKLPTLSQGAQDKPGNVYYVHRMQALIKTVAGIKNLPGASCLEVTGTFDGATTAALKAVQASFGIAADGICGQQSWGVLIAGSAQ